MLPSKTIKASSELYQQRVPGLENVNSWDVERAYAYCLWITRNHYENFPVGSVLIPKHLRPHVAAVYAFARGADDFADEKEFAQSRMDNLEAWHQALNSIDETSGQSETNHPVFVALADTLAKNSIPKKLFADLLYAFKMDVTKQSYATFEELLHYCEHSANPVGRIVLHLFGYQDEERMGYSDSICTALQLANHWQDVGVDLDKPRIYIPEEDMNHFGCSLSDIRDRKYSSQFRELLQFEVNRAEILFHEGRHLMPMLSGRLKYEIRATWAGGMTILSKIRELNYNTLQYRPKITTYDKIIIGLKTFSGWY